MRSRTASTARRTGSCRRRSRTRSATRGRVPTRVTVAYERRRPRPGDRRRRPGAPADDGGERRHGLVGMRERVAPARRRARGAARQRPRVRRAGADPAGAMSIRVLLVDDHALARTGLRMVLDTEPDIEVVGEAADGRQAIHSARGWRPTSSSWTSGCPSSTGSPRRARSLATAPAAPRVLDPHDVRPRRVRLRLARRGRERLPAQGRRARAARRTAIRVVAGGDALLAPSVTRRLIDEIVRAGRRARAPPSWTS